MSGCCAHADDDATRARDATVATKRFMGTSCRRERARTSARGDSGSDGAGPGRSWRGASMRRKAAIDRHADADHEARARAAQPEDRGGDLVGLAEPPDHL